ncbi:beta-ketoacyl-ACP synthase III [Sulfurimonas sp. SAG-AH-194-C21]|nr:beta-ketoacyl-ACP synthase III [Sulfurimonas sp. SAG-AH-194-C21]MDF1883130.1 beta-ketoacyl-ACP synthase III [Sulfurimonas sp. SAG-AH-194-C21]
MKKVYINKIGAFFPNEAVTNENMEAVLGQIGERPSRARRVILKSNKITSRYYAIDPVTGKTTHTNVELTANAIRALDDERVENLDLLVCGTTLPDQIMPNHAVMVHGALGLKPLEVVSTAGICLSGATALKYAFTSIKSGEASVAVSTGSENVSSAMRAKHFKEELNAKVNDLEKNLEIAFEKDFLRWMLSDGAGAFLLSDIKNTKGLSLEVQTIFSRSYANKLDACMYAGADKTESGALKGWREYESKEILNESIFSIKQDVKLLNDNIIEYTVTKPLIEMLEKKLFDPKEIDWFLPHYSSGYFRDKVEAGLKKANCDISQDKWFTNLFYKGNTGSASFYIILEELFNNDKFKRGEKILCYVPESGRFSTAFILLEVV